MEAIFIQYGPSSH